MEIRLSILDGGNGCHETVHPPYKGRCGRRVMEILEREILVSFPQFNWARPDPVVAERVALCDRAWVTAAWHLGERIREADEFTPEVWRLQVGRYSVRAEITYY
jgi:hypothetical protein